MNNHHGKAKGLRRKSLAVAFVLLFFICVFADSFIVPNTVNPRIWHFLAVWLGVLSFVGFLHVMLWSAGMRFPVFEGIVVAFLLVAVPISISNLISGGSSPSQAAPVGFYIWGIVVFVALLVWIGLSSRWWKRQ